MSDEEILEMIKDDKISIKDWFTLEDMRKDICEGNNKDICEENKEFSREHLLNIIENAKDLLIDRASEVFIGMNSHIDSIDDDRIISLVYHPALTYKDVKESFIKIYKVMKLATDRLNKLDQEKRVKGL